MIVADTNVLAEPLRAEPDPRVLDWLAQHGRAVAITSITVGELLFGALRLAPGRHREHLLSAINALVAGAGDQLLAYDESAARHFAALREQREAAGRVVSVEDTMIAAICLAGGHELATRNLRDFADSGLVLHNPWQA